MLVGATLVANFVGALNGHIFFFIGTKGQGMSALTTGKASLCAAHGPGNGPVLSVASQFGILFPTLVLGHFGLGFRVSFSSHAATVFVLSTDECRNAGGSSWGSGRPGRV